MNENYEQPEMPKGSKEGIVKGLYKFMDADNSDIRLVGSGSILRESIKAATILKNYNINAEVWSATSFNLLRKEGMETERENQLNPTKAKKIPYVTECFNDRDIPIIATTDYIRAYAEQIRSYISSSYTVLGTDGYGRSDSREKLREFFEINSNSIVRASAYALFEEDKIDKKLLQKIYKDMDIDPSKPNPWEV